MNITAKTKKLGIIGFPVEHSFSPKMHNYISDKLGNDYIYTGFTVAPDSLGDAVRGIRALGMRGVNVTAPHKTEVMQYLDRVDPRAKRLGSVNTVVNDNGVLTGYNTDSDGFFAALRHSGIEVRGKRVLVMGCGGVAKPTLMRMTEESPCSVTLMNRTKSRAEVMADEIYRETGFKIETDPAELRFDVVINMTSAGMEPQENTLPTELIDGLGTMDFIKDGMAAVDMIYNPPKTKFLREAEKRGAKILNGLDMLIYQGIIAYELFTGTSLPDGMADDIRRDVFGAAAGVGS